MSTATVKVVRCDECGELDLGVAGFTANRARERAQEAGWLIGLLHEGKRVDLCPACGGAQRLVVSRAYEESAEP